MPTRRKKTSSKDIAAETELPIGTALVAHAERAADCELDLIRLFLSQQRHDIARRRLQKLRDDFPDTAAAKEAHRLLKTL
jgi:hypothetical protein